MGWRRSLPRHQPGRPRFSRVRCALTRSAGCPCQVFPFVRTAPTPQHRTAQVSSSSSFPKLEPGDTTKVSTVREGWAVVNEIELERELPEDPDRRPLTILVSKAPERQHWALRYYRMRGGEVIEAEYERRLHELQQGRADTAQERENLRRGRDQARLQADRLAWKLSEAGPGEPDADVRRAETLFLEREIDEALELLSEARPKQQAGQAEPAKPPAVQRYLLRGKLLALRFRLEDAAAAYGEAVRLAPDDFEAQFENAFFNQGMNRLAPAQQGYERALAISRRLTKADPGTGRVDVARTLTRLGVLQFARKNYALVRVAFQEALATYRELAKFNPETYRPDVATTLNSLGTLDRLQDRNAEARVAYEEALAIYRDLAKVDPGTHRANVARTLNNMGALDTAQSHLDVLNGTPSHYEAARSVFGEALAIYRELANTNPEAYLPELADTLNNLGVLHSSQGHDVAARAALGEALAIYRQLAAGNPERFAPRAADVQRNLDRLRG